MNEIVIRLIDETTGTPITGQSANIVIKDNGGTPIGGLTVIEYPSQGNYKIYGFTNWYEFVTLWVNGVQMQSFGSQAAGDPVLKFINKDGTLAYTGNQSMGSHKLTNLSAGTASTDAANLGQVVKLAGVDTITGLKTFTGGVVVDVTGNILEVKNGATVNLIAQNNDFQFGTSSSITSRGTAAFRDAAYDPASTKYIANTFSNTDIPSAKWVATHFQGLSAPEQNNTVIVDSTHGGIDSGRIYQTIQSAINDIDGALRANPTDVWNIIIKPNIDHVDGYQEDITVPNYTNLTGEGQVKMTGQLLRSGSGSDRNCIIKNLHIYNALNHSHQVERFEAIDCVFETDYGQVVITKSKLRNCGFYVQSDIVNSGGDNKIINCFGNYNTAWNGSTDAVYSYDYVPGDIYNN